MQVSQFINLKRVNKMKNLVSNSIMILLLTFLVSQVKAQDISFFDVEPLPYPKSALTSANNSDFIFLANGFSQENQYTSDILKYDVNNNQWSTLTDASINKRYASAEIVEEFLYVFNGLSEGVLNAAVEKINIEDGSIEYLQENPQPVRAAGVASWNGKIYSFGGSFTPSEYSNLIYEFDPSSETWNIIGELPFGGETKGEIIDGKLYVLGGYNGNVSDQIYVFDISSETLESSFTMPEGISAHATAVIGSKIYLVGDFINLSSLACFDTADNSFSMISSNINQRRHCAAEAVNGSLYAIGGNTASTIESSISSVQRSDIETSNNTVSSFESMEIFPNPAASRIFLDMQYDEVKINGMNGQEVLNVKDANAIQIDGLINGQYILKAYKNDKIYQSRFVKSMN